MRTHKRSFASPVIFLALAAILMVSGCRKEEPEAQYPQQQYPTQQQYPPQQQYPAQQYPPQQYPAQPATQAPPGGVPCQTDADPQCPFGRCIAGKCGGCITVEHCKPAAACMQTPVGMACVPAGMPGAPQ
jgi:hypothetical protein